MSQANRLCGRVRSLPAGVRYLTEKVVPRRMMAPRYRGMKTILSPPPAIRFLDCSPEEMISFRSS